MEDEKMHKKILIPALLMSVVLIGCTTNEEDTNKLEDEMNQLTEEVSELTKKVVQQEQEISKLDNFSYLNDFTEEELTAYEQFIEDSDGTHLKHYTPENIVLLYLHSLTIGDIDTIHAITFDGGTLPDLDEFRDKVNDNDTNIKIHSAVFTNQSYDSIDVRDENKTEDSVGVEITASVGIHTSTTVYELKKENGQWKIALHHLLEDN